MNRPGVKVLLAGLGRWGENHLRVLREIGADVWVAEPDAARRALAVRSGLDASRVIADYHRALPHVDAVDVVTPADTHLELASAALHAGKACFVEKPLALTAAQGRQLAGVVEQTGGLLQVGHVFRFHPVTALVRERVEAGALGRVRYATARFAGFKRPRADVGVTRADALHCFDLLIHLLGMVPRAVTASLADHLDRGMDDASWSVVEFGSVRALVEVGYFAPGSCRECVIVGEEATVAADFAAGEVRVHANRHIRQSARWQASEGAVTLIKAVGPEPLRRELELFLDAVAGAGAPAVDVHAGVVALQVVDAAERSSQLGRRVSLSEMDATGVDSEGSSARTR